jgi:hypothetical protein
MSSTNCSTELELRIVEHGYAFVPARTMRESFEEQGSLSDWPAFAASWNDLAVDTHMADHGRYRRRRHAVFAATADGGIKRSPHQPHFQTLDYNPLNGGVERWFEPIEARFGDGPSLRAIIEFCRDLFDRLSPKTSTWHIETHQFRIEAVTGESALPTPEGMHRDGVDFVLVLLVCRRNINSGTTMIGASDGGFFSSFTLTEPFDAALVDDHRVYHGVTPVEPIDPSQPAYRDVLVVTFRRA